MRIALGLVVAAAVGLFLAPAAQAQTPAKVYTAGDVTSEVSIQSISKVFTMAKVMEESRGGRCR